MTTIVWLTLDLRTEDQPALQAAISAGHCLALYILDPDDPGCAQGAGEWWLHHSLSRLSESFKAMGGQLILRKGNTLDILKDVAKATGASGIFFSRAYEPWLSDTQKTVHEYFSKYDISCKRFAGRVLLEPDSILNKQHKPFQVFTPFYKHAKTHLALAVTGAPKNAKFYPKKIASDKLSAWGLLPQKPNWAKHFGDYWQPGEQGAKNAVQTAIDEALADYSEARDYPAKPGTSRLSPHLHFGEISPRQVWCITSGGFGGQKNQLEPFLRQLFWREFSIYLLHHFPHTIEKPFRDKFLKFPWKRAPKRLKAWQQGKTGYPIVDAGMRELMATGWMHNRVRMVAASFLTKHLNIHWREGAAWFWDTLLDADIANNTMGWQWVAGCGADAAPYFRIFNPTLQGEKFDAQGHYIRKWVPELEALDKKYLNAPWTAPAEILKSAGISLGTTYPKPIVDHKTARESALQAYKAIA